MFVLNILIFFSACILVSLFNHVTSIQRKAREAARQLQEQSEVQEEEPLDDDLGYEEPEMEDEPPAEPHHGYGYEHVRAEVPPHDYEYVRPEVPVQVPVQVPPQRELVEGPPRTPLVLPPSVPRELLLPWNQFRSPSVNPNPAYARRRFDNSRRLLFQPLTPQNPLREPLEET